MADATVVIATFGDRSFWEPLAARAAVSAAEQTVDTPVIHVHGETLHGARNEGLARVNTEFVVHLDADDTLRPDYIEKMLGGIADLRAPAVTYVSENGGRRPPRPIVPKLAGHTHVCTGDCLPLGNWLVVGSMVRTAVLINAGGWDDCPMYEDWCAWVRCWQAGASVEAVPDAVYEAHVRPRSRHRGYPASARVEAHRTIARKHGLPVP